MQSHNKLLSIICPIKGFFDGQIFSSLNSIVLQKDIHLLLIISENDYRNSLSEIQKRLEFYTNVCCEICVENDVGIYQAMNQGILHSNSEWVCFVGNDDFFDTNILIKLCGYLKKTKSELVFSNVLIGSKIKNKININKYALNLDSIGTSHSVGMFVRLNTHRSIGLYDANFKVSADYDFYIRCITEKTPISHFKYCVGSWGVSGFSSSQSIKNKLTEHYKIREKNKLPFIHSLTCYIYCFFIYNISKIKNWRRL